MNKLLIVLLAICLVSVHAFVKRDAPAETKGSEFGETIKKGFEDIQKFANEHLNADAIKKGFEEGVDTLNKAIKSFQDPAKKTE